MLARSPKRTAVAKTDRIARIARSLLIPNNLPINPLFSRFWIFTARSAQAKAFSINNLAGARKKNLGVQFRFSWRDPGHLCLSLMVRSGALSRRFLSAVVGDHVHLLALRTGTLHVGGTQAGAMATAEADATILRPAEHAAELAAQNTIGTAHDHFRHFLPTLLPFCLERRTQLDVGQWCRLRSGRVGEARNTLRSDSIACAVKLNTKVIVSIMKMARKSESIPRWCTSSFSDQTTGLVEQSPAFTLVHNSHAMMETPWRPNIESSE
jgi:hypothetical protein